MGGFICTERGTNDSIVTAGTVLGGRGGQSVVGSHPECTVIVSLIGPVISKLCVGVCIIRSVNQSNKRCIYSDSSTWLSLLPLPRNLCFLSHLLVF